MEPQTTTTRQPTLRDRLRMIFRRWRLLLLGSVLFSILALQMSLYIPARYTGITRFQRASDVTEEMSRSGAEPFEALKQTLAQEITQFSVMDKVVDDIGLTKNFPRDANGQLTAQGQVQKQALIGGLTTGIEVRWDVRSSKVDLVTVSCTSSDPVIAERLPNALVQYYIERTSARIVDRLNDSYAFLKRKTEEAKVRAADVERDRAEYIAQHAMMFPSHAGEFQQRMMQLEGRIDSLKGEISLAQQELKNVQVMRKPVSQMELTPVEIIKGPNGPRVTLQQELQNAYDELREVYTDQHPKSTALRAKIAKLEKRIAIMPEEMMMQIKYATGLSGAEMVAEETRFKSQIEIASAELERQEKLLKQYREIDAEIGPVNQKFQELTKKLSDADAETQRWINRLSEVEMALEAERAKRGTHLSTVDLARKQSIPSSPSLLYVLVGALGGGLAFGGALVFLAGMGDRTVSIPDDLSRFTGFKDIPIYGVIAEIVPPRQMAVSVMIRKALIFMLAAVLIAALAESIFSVVLWLRYPEVYAEWKASPVGMLFRFL